MWLIRVFWPCDWITGQHWLGPSPAGPICLNLGPWNTLVVLFLNLQERGQDHLSVEI